MYKKILALDLMIVCIYSR